MEASGTDPEDKVTVTKNEQGLVNGLTVYSEKYNMSRTYTVDYYKTNNINELTIDGCKVSTEATTVEYFRFVPTVTGTYNFQGTGEVPYGRININLWHRGEVLASTQNGNLDNVQLTAGAVYYIGLWQMSTDCDITLTVSLNGAAGQSALDEISVQDGESFTDEEALDGTVASGKDGVNSESSLESESQGITDFSDESAELENSISEVDFD